MAKSKPDFDIGVEEKEEAVENIARNEAFQVMVEMYQVETSPSKLELEKSFHEKEMEMLEYEEKNQQN